MSKERFYFAYGSNINLTQMEYRCPEATPLMPVMLHGYELTFRGGGVATVIPKEDAVTPGLLWSITPENEKSLDRYEGYPNYYHKTDIAVTDPETGKIYYPMMYEMDARYRDPSLPSFSYFDGIAEGYRQNNMDTCPLYDALYKTDRQMDELYEKRMREYFFTQGKPSSRSGQKNHKRNEKER